MRYIMLLACASACIPTLDDSSWLIDAPTLYAVTAEPAEVAPGQHVRLEAHVADTAGALADPMVRWGLCRTRRPLAELGPVAQACVDEERDALVELEPGVATTVQVPLDACSLFGPNPPPVEPGEPSGRPVDPDPTGGFYLPIFAWVDDGPPSFVQVRLRCGLADVLRRTASAYNALYQDNVSPAVRHIGVERADGTLWHTQDEAIPPTLEPGEEVRLHVGWSTCESTEGNCAAGDVVDPDRPSSCAPSPPCEGAESFLMYDRARAELRFAREAVSVRWYATAGDLPSYRAGVASDQAQSHAVIRYTAPDSEGWVTLAAVLRDSRGGIGTANLALEVRQ